MHVVTKILLVFCAVLSLLLAALTMSYAANAGAIRDGYRAMELDKLAAQAARDDVQSQWQLKEAKLGADVKAAQDQASQFQLEARQLQDQRTELRMQLEQEKAKAQAAEVRFVELVSTGNTQADIIKVYHQEVTSLRDDMVKANRREAELLDRINDLEAQREVIEQSARALQEQLKEAQLALQTAQSGGVTTSADQPFEHVGTPIYARVLSVFKSPSGEDLVTISEGANRNIKQNLRMNIKRGDKFLAKVVITTVDPNSAVGRVDKLGQDVTIQVDDEVVSTLLK